VNGFTYLQAFFSWSCKRAFLQESTTYLSFSLTLPRNFLKHRQVKYCITIVFSLVEIEHLQPVWRYVAFYFSLNRCERRRPGRRVHHPARERRQKWTITSKPAHTPAGQTLVPFACPRKKREKVRRNRLIIKNTYGEIDEILRWVYFTLVWLVRSSTVSDGRFSELFPLTLSLVRDRRLGEADCSGNRYSLTDRLLPMYADNNGPLIPGLF